jgi:hypothetical protein
VARRITLGIIALLSLAILGFAVYALVGLVSWKSLSMSASVPATKAANRVSGSLGSGASIAKGVESDFNANNRTAPYAAQQQVVNGWAAKDALEGLLQRTDALSDQNKELGAQLADDTNLLAARLDSLSKTITALLAVIALMAAAGCLLLLAIAIALVWRDRAGGESALLETAPVTVEAQPAGA